MRVVLEQNSVHLWVTYPNEIEAPALLLAYQALLSDAEKIRWQRFQFAKHRHAYLVTRALVRSVLSCYVDIAPSAWCFSVNEYGKPALMAGQTTLPLQFNVSHTEGMIVCAVVLTHDIGVDVECLQKKHAVLKLANYCFAPQEYNDVASLSADKQSKRFFEYWTLKEAYIKARGMGLALPLDKFAFSVTQPEHLHISFAEDFDDDATAWTFWQFPFAEIYLVALALQVPTTTLVTLRVNTVIPLQGELANA
jgi:4'-phosphopantetheinyl transferase